MARSGRILLAAEAVTATPITATEARSHVRASASERVVSAELVTAQLHAKALLEQASARAEREYARRLSEFEDHARERLAEVERVCQKREAECVLRETQERNATKRYQREELFGLACLLAERLLGEQLRLSPSSISTLTETVLREARGAKTLHILASAGDAAYLLTVKSALADQFQAEVEVREEPGLSSGDLIIESELGRTEAKVKIRLDYLLELLRQTEPI
jgi:flagellar biosynthesis/type III secretory pathway protein FliH